MNAVMLSIRPKYCELIASGKKTIEVRRTKPKIETPFRCYIYCTQSGKYKNGKSVKNIWLNRGTDKRFIENGKVIGEFICDKVITVDCDSVAPFDPETHEYIQDETCLDRAAFVRYTNFRKAFGWHISDLKIYDESKELNEFTPVCKYKGDLCEACIHYVEAFRGCCKTIERAPQSYMYVEELK